MGITVFLADNVPRIRKLEKALLEKEPDIQVVGEAEDEAKAMKLMSSLWPQVVLTDFGSDQPKSSLRDMSNRRTQPQKS